MASSRKTVTIFILLGLLGLALVVYVVSKGDLVETLRFRIRSDLLTANASLRTKNENCRAMIQSLTHQNHDLKKALLDQTIQYSMLNEAQLFTWQSRSAPSQDPPTSLGKESFKPADLSGLAGRKETLGCVSTGTISGYPGEYPRTCRGGQPVFDV